MQCCGLKIALKDLCWKYSHNHHLEIDLQTENDAKRLAKFGFPVKQIVTGGTCHLDARMVEKHLADWSLEDLDLLVVENVGNLVCPSSYDLGEDAAANHPIVIETLTSFD